MASIDNLRLSARSPTVLDIHNDEPRKISHLPRPTGPPTPLKENFNQSIRSRYGWTDKPANMRSRSPVRDALTDVQASAMETTPPGTFADSPVFVAGNENPTSKPAKNDMPRPRAVSPTASPTASRPGSPNKTPFRPPGRLSPTKDMTTLPPAMSPGEIYTPPKAFVKGQRSRIAKPLREPRRSASSAFDFQTKEPNAAPPSKYTSQTVKVKPTYTQRSVKSPTLTSKASLSSLFREPTSSAKPSSKVALSGAGSSGALLKPRSRGENTLAPSTPPRANSKAKRVTVPHQGPAVVTSEGSQTDTPPKSSAALRETIAKAKAARRKARESAGPADVSSQGPSSWPTDIVEDELSYGGDNHGLLRKRIQQATGSGYLNIAAMNLQTIPTEVMHMYDPEHLTTSWADLVDLSKLNVADNDLEELNEDMFPDMTRDDEEMNHQFLGLEVLDLHRNRLTRLPQGLSMLERLHTLNLSGNKLTNDILDIISQIPQLQELSLADNSIEGQLDLKRAENLEVLDLHGNAVSSFGAEALLKLKQLRILNLAGNKLSSLDWLLLSTSTLTELNISKNRFSGVLFPTGGLSFKELRSFDASYNALESLTASNDEAGTLFFNIRTLNLTGNKMTSLPSLRSLKDLLALELADNKLSEIPTDLAQLQSLKSANFANNDIRLIPAELATMANLTSINLVGNPLREKKYLTMGTTDLKLDLEKKLDPTEADDVPTETGLASAISNSQYRYTPSNGTLDLSSQTLSTIPMDLIDLSSEIHTLKLSNNELTSFPTELLSHPSLKYSLQSFDLSHNPQLHPTDYLTCELFMPYLKSLYIVSTGLTSLDALTTHLRAPELKEINISCHKLAGHVPWVRAWWPKVTTLLATDNWFNSVDVEGVRGLDVLDIRNNEIEALPAKIGLLGNLPGTKDKIPGRLRVLEVSGNRFRVPRLVVVEKGTEAVLKDLRRMVKAEEVTDEWRDVL
ncbi:hypothetical protein A1O7_08755 [Cladophialophora yegresii CBS 114405]|uniref:Leucine-rich repeat-containing protein 40 n=1 Tax=Cladophialophora yegresii CBS 114405 TaxID=1182544 RepID=W9WB97_9EURO|nr:uncharacterized protein A1O7_08755 [Cladophialophora yegresii CBS 114405]EXJ55824.1 hypothetical protein A1O7_08755 [Cladophialophora yegresii CBS 114405]